VAVFGTQIGATLVAAYGWYSAGEWVRSSSEEAIPQIKRGSLARSPAFWNIQGGSAASVSGLECARCRMCEPGAVRCGSCRECFHALETNLVFQ